MSEAVVKTSKRDYVRVNPLPDVLTALWHIAGWIEDYNEIHPHSALKNALASRVHPSPTFVANVSDQIEGTPVVVQVPAPARLIEVGMPTEATVAQILVSKLADNLPLYSQAQFYARQSVHLDRSKLADWGGRAVFLQRPVDERLLECLKASSKLFADETTAPVLHHRRG